MGYGAKKTFTRWVNIHLKKKQMSIEDLVTDTRNGVAWCNLLEIIGGETMKAVTGRKFNKKPKFEIHFGENINQVLQNCEKDLFSQVGSGDLIIVMKNYFRLYLEYYFEICGIRRRPRGFVAMGTTRNKKLQQYRCEKFPS